MTANNRCYVTRSDLLCLWHPLVVVLYFSLPTLMYFILIEQEVLLISTLDKFTSRKYLSFITGACLRQLHVTAGLLLCFSSWFTHGIVCKLNFSKKCAFCLVCACITLMCERYLANIMLATMQPCWQSMIIHSTHVLHSFHCLVGPTFKNRLLFWHVDKLTFTGCRY